VKTCHKRGAFALGGWPRSFRTGATRRSRRRAREVRDDKKREATDGLTERGSLTPTS